MTQRQAKGWARHWYWPVLTLLAVLLLRYFFFAIYWVDHSPIPERVPDRSWCLLLKGGQARLGDVVLCAPSALGVAPALARVLALPSDTLRVQSGGLTLGEQSYPLTHATSEPSQRILSADEYCLSSVEPADSLGVEDLTIVPSAQIQARLLFYLPLAL